MNQFIILILNIIILILSLSDSFYIIIPLRVLNRGGNIINTGTRSTSVFSLNTQLNGKKSRSMGGKQGVLVAKLATAKKQQKGEREDVNSGVDDDVKDPVSSEEAKMRRDFDYLLKNDAYSMLSTSDDSLVEMASSPEGKIACPPPPPKVYVGDDFPLSESALKECLLSPSGTPSIPCGSAVLKLLIIDPRPNSSFLRDAFSEIVSSITTLPKDANYVFVSPTPAGGVRRMVKTAMKGNQKGAGGFVKDGYEDLVGRVQIYTTGEEGGLYRTLGIKGEGQILSLWVLGEGFGMER